MRGWLAPLAAVLVLIPITTSAIWSTTAAAEPASQRRTAPPCCVAPTPAQPAVPDLRGTSQQPLLVNATLPPKSAEEKAAEAQERAERLSTDTWTRGIGIATILVLIAQAIAFIVQAHRLRQSVIEMQRATQATQQVAQAEQLTVDTMQATARRELKAYVFLHTSRVFQLGPNGRPEARVTFKNYGKTPAYKVKLTLDCGWAASFENLPQPPSTAVDVSTLGPDAEFTANTNDPSIPVLSAEDYQSLIDGTQTLYVYGTIRYEDAFGNQNRFQKFRLRTGSGPGLPAGVLSLCKVGNETDEPD
jgi:hypothetical protein